MIQNLDLEGEDYSDSHLSDSMRNNENHNQDEAYEDDFEPRVPEDLIEVVEYEDRQVTSG